MTNKKIIFIILCKYKMNENFIKLNEKICTNNSLIKHLKVK